MARNIEQGPTATDKSPSRKARAMNGETHEHVFSDIQMPTAARAPEGDPANGITMHPYRGMAGELLFVMRREEVADVELVYPLMYCKRDGQRGWWDQQPPEPKPLYNLPSLRKREDGKDLPVLLVYGENVVDAFNRLRTGNACTTWPGTNDSIPRINWSPLAGRKVWYLHNNDDAGIASIGPVQRELLAAGVLWLKILPSLEEKVLTLIESGAFNLKLLAQMSEAAEKIEATPVAPVEEARVISPAVEPAKRSGLPLALGMRGEKMIILDRRGPQTVEFSRADAGRKILEHCADMAEWQRSDWFNEKSGVDFAKAAGEYVGACLKLGQVAADRVRGKGVFVDQGRIVANLAREGLLVDGVVTAIDALHDSTHTYVTSGEFVPIQRGMDVKEARRIADTLFELRWADPWYALAFVGWLAMAPVCGTIEWRSNLWLSGQSGSGKTFIMNQIARRLLEPVALRIQGNNSEAGVRQALNGRATPVLWDEFEAESKRAVLGRESVMHLVRSVCSGDSKILRGSASGGSPSVYHIVATFLFASINSAQRQRADIRRTMTVELATPNPDKALRAEEQVRFRRVESAIREWDSQVGVRWTWRAVAQAANIERSRTVIIPLLMSDGTSRATADQLSTYFAGYWSTQSDEPITAEQAESLIEETYRKWVQVGARGEPLADEEQDETSLVRCLMDQQVSITVDEDRGQTVRCSVRELVKRGVNRTLQRFGMRFDKDRRFLVIASSHPELSRLLANSPWAGGHDQVLRRLDGAHSVTAREYEIDGRMTGRRGTAIPLRYCELQELD